MEQPPTRERNWGRVIQGFLLALLLGVFALPMVWFFGRDPDRMTGLVVGIILNVIVVLAIVAGI